MADINKIGEGILNAPKAGTMEKPASATPIDREGPIPGAYEALGAVGDFLTGQSYSNREAIASKSARAVNKVGKTVGDYVFGGGEFMQAVSENRQPELGSTVEAGINMIGPVAKVVAPAAVGFGWLWKQMGREAPQAVKGTAKKMGGFLGGKKAIDKMSDSSPLKQKYMEAYNQYKSGLIIDESQVKDIHPGLSIGYDRKLRFEISDKDMKWIPTKPVVKKGGWTPAMPISDVIDHEAFYAVYPDLKKNLKVKWKNLGDKFKGYYDHENGVIVLNSMNVDKSEQQLTTALHEIQHSIQAVEEFSRGGNADTILDTLSDLIPSDKMAELDKEQLLNIATKLYAYKGGEVEARMVQNKLAKELNVPLWSQDVAAEVKNRGKAADVAKPTSERVDVPQPKHVWTEKDLEQQRKVANIAADSEIKKK